MATTRMLTALSLAMMLAFLVLPVATDGACLSCDLREKWRADDVNEEDSEMSDTGLNLDLQTFLVVMALASAFLMSTTILAYTYLSRKVSPKRREYILRWSLVPATMFFVITVLYIITAMLLDLLTAMMVSCASLLLGVSMMLKMLFELSK